MYTLSRVPPRRLRRRRGPFRTWTRLRLHLFQRRFSSPFCVSLANTFWKCGPKTSTARLCWTLSTLSLLPRSIFGMRQHRHLRSAERIPIPKTTARNLCLLSNPIPSGMGCQPFWRPRTRITELQKRESLHYCLRMS